MILESLLQLGEPILEAKPVRVNAVRNGKLTKKWKCPDKYKVVWNGKPGEGTPKCEKMNAVELRQLSKRAKLAARRNKGKRKLAAKKAKKSRKKGARVGVYSRNKSKLRQIRR